MSPILLIAALASDRGIGNGNALLFRLKTDMANFRAATLGKPVIMGRKTFESLAKPLPKRLNIVISRQPDLAIPGVVIAPSLDAALAVAHGEALRTGVGEIVVMGGAEIYALAMPLADRLLITHVDAAPAADVFFPTIDQAVWTGMQVATHPAGPDDRHPFRIIDYRRASG
ncbi:dihydrofolate reductase [Phreatobacter sp.]|uniref:dihydrofolate reductase n=1 Tax=Phreatobacter sp. TaxID=1966341 RepID=UPI0025D8BBA0|nr:dihydrofolate reductase [Phreatobacter sp.]